MNKLTKYVLLLLLAIPYIIVSMFDLTFGTLSLIMNVIRAPFKIAADKIIDKANEINTK
jgi:hypothetical protein